MSRVTRDVVIKVTVQGPTGVGGGVGGFGFRPGAVGGGGFGGGPPVGAFGGGGVGGTAAVGAFAPSVNAGVGGYSGVGARMPGGTGGYRGDVAYGPYSPWSGDPSRMTAGTGRIRGDVPFSPWSGVGARAPSGGPGGPRGDLPGGWSGMPSRMPLGGLGRIRGDIEAAERATRRWSESLGHAALEMSRLVTWSRAVTVGTHILEEAQATRGIPAVTAAGFAAAGIGGGLAATGLIEALRGNLQLGVPRGLGGQGLFRTTPAMATRAGRAGFMDFLQGVATLGDVPGRRVRRLQGEQQTAAFAQFDAATRRMNAGFQLGQDVQEATTRKLMTALGGQQEAMEVQGLTLGREAFGAMRAESLAAIRGIYQGQLGRPGIDLAQRRELQSNIDEFDRQARERERRNRLRRPDPIGPAMIAVRRQISALQQEIAGPLPGFFVEPQRVTAGGGFIGGAFGGPMGSMPRNYQAIQRLMPEGPGSQLERIQQGVTSQNILFERSQLQSRLAGQFGLSAELGQMNQQNLRDQQADVRREYERQLEAVRKISDIEEKRLASIDRQSRQAAFGLIFQDPRERRQGQRALEEALRTGQFPTGRRALERLQMGLAPGVGDVIQQRLEEMAMRDPRAAGLLAARGLGPEATQEARRRADAALTNVDELIKKFEDALNKLAARMAEVVEQITADKIEKQAIEDRSNQRGQNAIRRQIIPVEP